ncbi:BMA-ZFP-2 isoform b [Trichostrongylus colubriformis]|uniref:BMA-ZFP-2 isoform b n=1 Tax=Trichostrongylus colubriformis TaxID=6319 RepID=A0AAN8J1H4_TRICO
MDADEAVEPSNSLASFGSPVMFSDGSFEIFDTAGAEAGSVGSVVELAMEESPSTSQEKQAWPYVEGMRAIELVESKCYRTPHGFQKEATFPCQTLYEGPSTASSEDGNSVDILPEQEETQNLSGLDRRGPLEKFTLMIGENILHFKIIKAHTADQSYGDEAYGSSPCKCPFCHKMLQTKTACEEHITTFHCSSKSFRCDTCGAMFSSKVSLAVHMRYHTGPRPYRCTVCTKSFCRPYTLSLHMKMHMTGHRHFCQICGRWFKSLTALAEHENTCLAMLNGDFVNTDRPFRWQCSFCEKMFHHRRDKNIHERVHTGEKPYTCGYCGRGFSQSQTLTIHIRTHTGEKPYACSVCGQEFRDSSALRKHEYRHTAVAPSSVVSSLYDDSTIEIGRTSVEW